MPLVSCGVVLLDRRRAIFTCRASGTQRWDLPKGVGEPGEDHVGVLDQRAAQHEVDVAALVEVVAALLEDRERVPRLLLRELRRTTAQMDLCERRHRLSGVGVVAEHAGFLRLGDIATVIVARLGASL